MKVLQINIKIKYKKGIINRLAIKTFKQWRYCLEKIGQKNTPPHSQIENEDGV